MQTLYIYESISRPNEIKYGIFHNNRYERIIDGQTHLGYKINIIKLYHITKLKDYKLYKDIDNIISIGGRNTNFIIKLEKYYNCNLDYLKKISSILINGNGGTELIKYNYLDILINCIDLDLIKLNLNIKEYSNEEYDNVNTYLDKFNQKKHKELEDNTLYILNELENANKTNLNFNIREYQHKAIDYCYNTLINKGKLYLELATGAGKTFITINIIKKILPKLIICFSPRRKINDQLLTSKYINYLDNNYKTLYFTNSEVKSFIDNNINNNKLIVCCIQSYKNIYNNLISKNNLDNLFVWFDEAHWAIEESWIDKIDNDNAIKYFLTSDKIKCRFYTSASSNYKIVQLNNNIFGELYKPISVTQLIYDKWVCSIKANIFEQKLNDNINLINYILQTFKKYNKSWGFSFHNRDKNAFNLFKEHYDMFNKCKTEIKPFLLIDTSKLKNKLITIPESYLNEQEYENTPNSISYVVKKYDMGYDFSKLDYIIFSDPKLSSKDIIQCIGRGTRSDKLGVNGTNLNKKLNILLPIYVENEEDTDYKNIINVLRYLIHDLGIDVIHSILNKNKKVEHGDTDKEYTDVDYKGNDEVASKILDLLDFTKNLKNTKYVIELCIKNKIYNDNDYKEFITNNKHIKLRPSIYDYKDFKWKPIVDPNNEIYYSNIQECNDAVNQIKQNIQNKLRLKQIIKQGWIGYHNYDKKIPPYNKLEEYYY